MHRYRKNIIEIKVFEGKYLALRHYSIIMDEVSDLPKDAKISDYEKSFRDNGYDEENQIVSMTYEDLRSFQNMFNFSTNLAQKRFLTSLDAYKVK